MKKFPRGRLLVLPLCLIAPKFLANGLGPGTSQPAPNATRPAAKGQRFHVPQHRANPQTRLLQRNQTIGQQDIYFTSNHLFMSKSCTSSPYLLLMHEHWLFEPPPLMCSPTP